MVLSPRFKSLTYLIVENDYEERVYFYLVVMYILQHLSFQCYWSYLLCAHRTNLISLGEKKKVSSLLEFLFATVASWERGEVGSILARHSGLRIWHCLKLQHRLQLWLRSDPWPGNSICCRGC